MADQQSNSISVPETPKEQLIYTSTAVLQQAVDLVSNVLDDDEQLVFASRVLPGSTIGKHLRHARDYFNLLLECLLRPKPYMLNYDVRVRNVPMETSRTSAISALQETIDHLRQLGDADATSIDDQITMDAVTPYPQTMHTSVGRELWFAQLHAIHHWSVIRLIATGELGIELDQSFGVAPSTLQHHGQEALTSKARF